MEKVRIGIIGIGNIGVTHVKRLEDGSVQGGELVAVCDGNPERLKYVKENFNPKILTFNNTEDFFSTPMDGVIIAVPHFAHTDIAIEAFKRGLHVLVEKPAGVYTKQVKEMNEAAIKSGKVFGIMYNQRTNPLYQKLKDIIQSGELGEIKRTNWIITDWYRPQSYYNQGEWRGTWAGEGGGVIINQSPHQLDIWQWICGMPKRVRAFIYCGKHHDIEVEDDVTAYVEYENGATGVFITSTGDAPGTNRLEVTGDRGKIIIENETLNFWRLCKSERKFNKEHKSGDRNPECWKCEIPIKEKATKHSGIVSNWINAIQKGEKLLAPGVEGINGLQISNAIYLSSWTDQWVDLPVDEDLFYMKLKEKMKNSTFKKN